MTEVKKRKFDSKEDITPSPPAKRRRKQSTHAMDESTDEETADTKELNQNWSDALQDINIKNPEYYFKKLHAALFFIASFILKKVFFKERDCSSEDMQKLSHLFVDGSTALHILSRLFYKQNDVSVENAVSKLKTRSSEEQKQDYARAIYNDPKRFEIAVKQIKDAIYYVELASQHNLIDQNLIKYYANLVITTWEKLPGGKELLNPIIYCT